MREIDQQGTAARVQPVAIFRRDPDLLDGLAPQGAARLRDLEVPAFRVGRESWQPPSSFSAFGYLILDGLVTRETRVPGCRSIELVGPGDVVLTSDALADSFITSAVHWNALGSAEIAILQPRLIAELARAPVVLAELARRAADRADQNQVQTAIAAANPVKRRLEMLLWHLADRWGVRVAGAVELRLRLTQEQLASLTATTRESVCRELIHLVNDGVLERLPANRFRLVGRPPAQELIAQAEAELERVRGKRPASSNRLALIDAVSFTSTLCVF